LKDMLKDHLREGAAEQERATSVMVSARLVRRTPSAQGHGGAMIHHATEGPIVIAAQHLFGGAPSQSMLDSLPIFCAKQHISPKQPKRARIMETAAAHDVDVLVGEAFEKSWRFVRTDPILAHGSPEMLRAHLSRRLQQLAQDGERDVWRLANGAIADVRRELTAA
jgi:hypothetical protein